MKVWFYDIYDYALRWTTATESAAYQPTPLVVAPPRTFLNWRIVPNLTSTLFDVLIVYSRSLFVSTIEYLNFPSISSIEPIDTTFRIF